MTNSSDGYTVVELIVAIIVAGLFAISIFQLFITASTIASESSRRVNASSLAYANLRKYANNQAPLWFRCVGDEASETTPPFSDGKAYPSATGIVLLSTTSATSIDQLPPPITQTVTALAPYGCGNSGTGLPVRIQSQVSYGSPIRTVTHATLSQY